MNQVILTGNLVRKPEKVETSNGKSLCKIAIAVNNDYKDKDGKYGVNYFNIVAWGTLADNCVKYLDKGSRILIKNGELNNRNYVAEDGTVKYVYEIVAKEIEFIYTNKN